MSIRIRRATLDEKGVVPTLSRLHTECLGKTWSEAEIEALLVRKEIGCYLSELDGKVSGFILFQCVGDEGEIINMGVVPSARRKGTGASLLEEALGHCRAQKVASLWLEVAEDNEAAIGLYKKLGFIAQGRRKSYYATKTGPIDALTFKATLNA
jgi:[ribosomal protein S18]-alanine N-acetyltransferase